MLFQRMCVFAGPFNLDAAEAVCDHDDSIDVLNVLVRLADRSMVAVRRGESTTYELLETMRDFGRNRLDDEESVGLFQAHATHYADLVNEIASGLTTPAERQWVDRAGASFADLRAAHHFATQVADLDVALGIVGAIREFGMRVMRYEMMARADTSLGLPSARSHELYPLVKAVQSYGS